MRKKIPAYKAFDANWKCHEFQYEIGETYIHDGDVELCRSGFHSCLSPLDCWTFYSPVDSKFAVVEVDDTQPEDESSGIVSSRITIVAELTQSEFIAAGVSWLIEKTTGRAENGVSWLIEKTTGRAENGEYAQIGSSGDNAQIGCSGYLAHIGSSGDNAQIGCSGDYAHIGSSGEYAHIGCSGYNAQIGCSGEYAYIGCSSEYAHIGCSGDYAQIGCGGDNAQIGCGGDYAQIGCGGEGGVISSSGRASTARGSAGTWISLADFDSHGDCLGFATGCIGHDGLEPDTFYRASGGKLVPA